jgi:protein disulfide-isomerase A6
MLEKKSLAPEKLDEVRIKANILAAFVALKAEEAEGNIEDLKHKVEAKAKEIKDEL